VKCFAVRFARIAVLVVSICAIQQSASKAYGQTPAATPPAEKQTSSSPPQRQNLTEREKRAQAYAKLLEGQRNLSDLRREGTATTLRSAKQAFQDAANLDPTLAEAHTALAEIAFYYPPQDFDAAAREGASAARVDPDNFGAHRLLARLFTIKSGLKEGTLNRSAVDFAIRELKHVVRLDKNNAEAWAFLGELYQATGKPAEALEAWSRWAAAPQASDTRFFQYITNRELSPDAASARLSEALLAAGRGAEALAAIRRAIALDPENKDYIELLGQIIEGGALDDKAAIIELQRMVAGDPSNIRTVQLLVRVQARAGRVDDAAASLRSAIARQPNGDREHEMLRASLAQLYIDALRYTDAIAVLEEQIKALNLNEVAPPSDAIKASASRLLHKIIDVYKSAGQPAGVTATIERMRRLLGKDDPSPDAQQIEFLRDQGRLKEALLAVRAARQRYPEQTGFLQLEAQTLADLGRVDEGVALINASLKGSIEDFEEHLFISSLYLQSGRSSEAVTSARKALDLAPTGRPDMVENALVNLSSAQERAGDPKGAEESLRRILAADPDNATALNNLGYFLVDRNDRLPEALEMIKRALRSSPTNPSFLDSLGWAFFRLGRFDEAERNLLEAARRNLTSSTINEHLGDLYSKQGKHEQARVAWQKALTLAAGPQDTARLKGKIAGKPGK
jgi:tetratricopeptide (TPR) repeat protein